MLKKSLTVIFVVIISCIPIFTYAQDEPTVEIVVQKGHSLIKIAKEHLEDPNNWRQLTRINLLKNPDLIYPGQIILIPVRLLKGKSTEGVVSFLKGNVLFQPEGSVEWKPIFLNDRIREGCKIKTGDESSVEITFEDGDSFLQRSNTNLGLSTAREKVDFYSIFKLFLQTGQTITHIKKVTGRESRFQIDTPSAVCATRGTIFRTAVDLNDVTRLEVLKGSVSVEAMNQKVRVEEGEGTLAKKGEPPLQPKKLLSPPALTEYYPIYKKFPILLSFEKVESANSYRILFTRDKDFKDIMRDEVIKPNETFELSVIEDGTYFLQTLTIDELGLEGLPSEPIMIKIRIHPVPPFIEFPVDKKVYRKKSLKLRWLEVDDAVRYHLQIAEDSEFINVIKDKADIEDTAYETGTLEFKNYYIRVSSVASDGYQGEWSDILSFTMAPVLEVDFPEIDKKEIRIRWQNFGEDITYHFQMSREKDFKEILVEKIIDTPELIMNKPKQSGKYYVRVSPIDLEGFEGDFSDPQSFEIKKSFLHEFLGIAGALGLILLLIY